MDYDDPTQNLHIHLEKGYQLLDGKKAEEYMRFRKTNSGHFNKEMSEYYDGSDLKRIDAQQSFFIEFLNQKFTLSNITKINKLKNVIFNKINTNVKLENSISIITKIKNFNIENINSFKINGYSANESQWFFIYNDSIICTKNNKIYSSNDIVENYFNSKSLKSAKDIKDISPIANPKIKK